MNRFVLITGNRHRFRGERQQKLLDASAADLIKSKQAKSEPVAHKVKSA